MRGKRFLVLSASMGSGHDSVASVLMTRLTSAGHTADRADVLDLLPAGGGAALRAFYRGMIGHLPVLYSAIYAAFFRDGATPRPGSTPLAALAASRLLRLVATQRPDVVVSVFHLAAQTAGRLRAQGTLSVPSAVFVTDFAVHRQWLHPGNDLYLCLTGELATKTEKSLSRPAVTAGPLVASRFTEPAAAARAAGWRRQLESAARRQLEPADGPVVLLSTGAWGAASQLTGTTRLLASAGYLPVVLCGASQRLRQRLSAVPHAIALGWVDDMPGLMAAAAALIDNAAGQTAQQALAAGLPVISYRPIPGHGAAGVRAMGELGLTDHAGDPASLLHALARLSRPGAFRERRIAAGRALFAADGITPLEDLAGRCGLPDGKHHRTFD